MYSDKSIHTTGFCRIAPSLASVALPDVKSVKNMSAWGRAVRSRRSWHGEAPILANGLGPCHSSDTCEAEPVRGCGLQLQLHRVR